MPRAAELTIPPYDTWPTWSNTERARLQWRLAPGDEFGPGDELAMCRLDEPAPLAIVKSFYLCAPRHGRLVTRIVNCEEWAYPGMEYAVVELRSPTLQEWQGEHDARVRAEMRIFAFEMETATPRRAFKLGWRHWRGKPVDLKGYVTNEDLGLGLDRDRHQ